MSSKSRALIVEGYIETLFLLECPLLAQSGHLYLHRTCRFRGQSGHGLLQRTCLLLTHSGHRLHGRSRIVQKRCYALIIVPSDITTIGHALNEIYSPRGLFNLR